MSIAINQLPADSVYKPGYNIASAMTRNGENLQGVIAKRNINVDTYRETEMVWVPVQHDHYNDHYQPHQPHHPHNPHNPYNPHHSTHIHIDNYNNNRPYKVSHNSEFNISVGRGHFNRHPIGHYEERVVEQGFKIRGQKYDDSSYNLVKGVIVDPKTSGDNIIRVAVDRDNNGKISEKDTQIAIKLDYDSWRPRDTKAAGTIKAVVGSLITIGGLALAATSDSNTGRVLGGIGAGVGGVTIYLGAKDHQKKFDQIATSPAKITFEQ